MQGFIGPLTEPVDGAAVDQRRELTQAGTEHLTNRTEKEIMKMISYRIVFGYLTARKEGACGKTTNCWRHEVSSEKRGNALIRGILTKGIPIVTGIQTKDPFGWNNLHLHQLTHKGSLLWT